MMGRAPVHQSGHCGEYIYPEPGRWDYCNEPLPCPDHPAKTVHEGHGPGQCRYPCPVWESMPADERAKQMTDTEMLAELLVRMGAADYVDERSEERTHYVGDGCQPPHEL